MFISKNLSNLPQAFGDNPLPEESTNKNFIT